MTSREYPGRPLVGVGVVLLKPPGSDTPGAVLLVRRSKPPAMGSWSLPGGAQKLGETAEYAARRELAEETGLEAGSLVLAANVDSIHRDAAGRIQFHYTIIDFAGLWQSGEPAAGGDVTEAVFAPLDDLGRFELWHEAHRVIGVANRLLSSACDGTGTACQS
jgi:ADP-ribose pyrophosphatase YjhB (NUDIX family)